MEERLTSLRDNKTVIKEGFKSIDDILVNLNIKITEIERNNVISKIKRKLLNSIDLETFSILVKELNSYLGEKRKIKYTLLNGSNFNDNAVNVLYQVMDLRNAEKTHREVKSKVDVLLKYIPIFIEITNEEEKSFYTLLQKDIKDVGFTTYKNKTNVFDFRTFFAEEILNYSLLKSLNKKSEKEISLLQKMAIAMKFSQEVEVTSLNKINFKGIDFTEYLEYKNISNDIKNNIVLSTIFDEKSITILLDKNGEKVKNILGLNFKNYNSISESFLMAPSKFDINSIDPKEINLIKDNFSQSTNFVENKLKELGLNPIFLNNKKISINNNLEYQKFNKIIANLIEVYPVYSDNLIIENYFNNFLSNTEIKNSLSFIGINNYNDYSNSFKEKKELIRKLNLINNIIWDSYEKNISLYLFLTSSNFDLIYNRNRFGKNFHLRNLNIYFSNILLLEFVEYYLADIQYKHEESSDLSGERAKSYEDTKIFTDTLNSYKEKIKNGDTKFTKYELIIKESENSKLKTIFNQIELDKDISIDKFKRFEKEVLDFVKLFKEKNIPKNVYFKARKLGNHKALGVYFPLVNTLVIDVDSPSSFIHEFGHMLDFYLGEISANNEFKKIVENTINYIKNTRLNTTDVKLKEKLLGETKYNLEYYSRPREIFARSFELYFSLYKNQRSPLLEIESKYKNDFPYNVGKEILIDIKDYFDKILN